MLCFSVITAAQKSEILGKVGKFMPTVTESATLGNMVNVYMKISDWVRATNTVVKSMRSSVNDIRLAKETIEGIVTTVQSMKEFSLYDMDSWANTVDKMEYVVGTQTNKVAYHLGMFEMHTLGASVNYFDRLKAISQYDIRENQQIKRANIQRAFGPGGHSNTSLMILGVTEPEYLDNEIKKLEDIKLNLARRINSSSFTSKRILEDSLIMVDADIVRYKRKRRILKLNGKAPTTKIDSIMMDAQEMMAVNLTEVDVIQSMTQKIGEYSIELLGGLDRIRNNNLPTSPNSMYSENDGDDMSTDFQQIENYGDHPNQAPTPELSEDGKSGTFATTEMSKKSVTTQDVISIRNAANFTLLKQERLLRDIEAMKTNTLAYIVLIEGWKRNKHEYARDVEKFHATKMGYLWETK